MAGIKKIVALAVFGLMTAVTFGQGQIVTSGKIVFERKTNLKKIFKDNDRVKRFLDKDVTWKIEQFQMYFNESGSAFTPIESDEPDQGFMKYLTTHNTIYKDMSKQEKTIVLDMWGTETYVRDSMTKRQWKITNRSRKIAGYKCTRAIWEQNDTTRIYAWFTVDIVPSVGPEGFDGLPGAILGLATENGSIIYFAKEVELMEPKAEVMTRDVKGKDVFTVAALKERLLEKMGQWVKKEDLDAMFSWL